MNYQTLNIVKKKSFIFLKELLPTVSSLFLWDFMDNSNEYRSRLGFIKLVGVKEVAKAWWLASKLKSKGRLFPIEKHKGKLPPSSIAWTIGLEVNRFFFTLLQGTAHHLTSFFFYLHCGGVGCGSHHSYYVAT